MRHGSGSNTKHGDKPSNPEDIARRRYDATRCAWTTNGRGCLLTGSSSPDTGGLTNADGTVTSPRAFCSFHIEALSGRGASDSAEFAAWHEAHVEQFPARTYGHSEFTRCGSEDLWRAAIGIERAPGPDAKPRPDARPASQEARRKALGHVREALARRNQ